MVLNIFSGQDTWVDEREGQHCREAFGRGSTRGGRTEQFTQGRFTARSVPGPVRFWDAPLNMTGSGSAILDLEFRGGYNELTGSTTCCD